MIEIGEQKFLAFNTRIPLSNVLRTLQMNICSIFVRSGVITNLIIREAIRNDRTNK